MEGSARRGLRAAWLMALAALLAAGCGTGGAPLDRPEPVPTQSSDTAAATGPAAGPSPSAGRTTTPTPSAEPEKVSYVPWGPSDPVVPEHYGRLAQRDCGAGEQVAPDEPFWDAVFAVCRTLVGGEPWPDLAEAPPAPETENPHESCLDDELEIMVRDALAWRDANDDATPQVEFEESGSACYLAIYEAGQVSPEQDITSSLPGEATISVLLDATLTIAQVSVDRRLIAEGDMFVLDNEPFVGTRTLSIHVPGPPESRTVEVAVSQTLGDSVAGVARVSVLLEPVASGPGVAEAALLARAAPR